MSRFLVITADVGFEKRVRQAAAGMHGGWPMPTPQ